MLASAGPGGASLDTAVGALLVLAALTCAGIGALSYRRLPRMTAAQAQTNPQAVPGPVSVSEDMARKWPLSAQGAAGAQSSTGSARPHVTQLGTFTVAAPPWLAAQLPAPNLCTRSPVDCGQIVPRLWWVLSEIAHVLPHHAFTFETDPELPRLCVEASAFALAFAALVLHSAQSGRLHAVQVSLMPETHPQHPRDGRPRLLLRVTTVVERRAVCFHLGQKAVALCKQAGGAGSICADREAWMMWPLVADPKLAEV